VKKREREGREGERRRDLSENKKEKLKRIYTSARWRV